MEAALEGWIVDGGVVDGGKGLDSAGAVVVDDRGREIVGARARRASLARADEAHHRVELVRVGIVAAGGGRRARRGRGSNLGVDAPHERVQGILLLVRHRAVPDGRKRGRGKGVRALECEHGGHSPVRGAPA